MHLLVQNFLQTNNFIDLAKQHGVYASFNKTFTKCSLNYDQIEAKNSDKLACQCRGVILSKEDLSPFGADKESSEFSIPGNTKIISRGFDRFFNYGDGEDLIDWNNISVFEKLDGTCTFCYYCPISNNWHIATRSSPEADIPLSINKYTFRSLFEKALAETTSKSFEDFCKGLDKDYTYIYELTTPINLVVVKYDDYKIHLLGVRNLTTQKEELNLSNFANGVPVVPHYNMQTINDVLKYTSEINPIQHEGVVVRDFNYHRTKVKSPAYVLAHRTIGSLVSSDRARLALVLTDKLDDVKPMLPLSIFDELMELQGRLLNLYKYNDQKFNEFVVKLNQFKNDPDYSSWSDQKIFASIVKGDKTIFETYMFSRFRNACSSFKDFASKQKKDNEYCKVFIDGIINQLEIVHK